MGFRGTPHRSDGDRLPGVGLPWVGGEGFEAWASKCVRIHTDQHPSTETLIKVQWTFFFFFCTGQLGGLLVGRPSSGFTFRREWQAANHCPNLLKVVANYTLKFIKIFPLCWRWLKSLPSVCSLSIVRLFRYQWPMRTVVLRFFSVLAPTYRFFFTILTFSLSLQPSAPVFHLLHPCTLPICQLKNPVRIGFIPFWYIQFS